MLSLYLHVPFCKQKCAYCAFYSSPHGDREAYTAALCHAIEQAGKAESRPLSTLYIGGGTPALLGTENLSAVLQTVRRAFALEDGCEITAELNPESTTPALLAMLKQEGVNRLSVGIQSLQDSELKTLGRLHDRAAALAALQEIFAAGFTNVSADVMFGLPHQTPECFADTLSTLLQFPLTHLSAYALQWEEGTPLGDAPAPMDEDAEEALWQLLCRTTAEAGLEHYEISNFARPGYRSRHNSGYWQRTDYIGLGPAAHSFWKGVRYAYPPDRESFCANPWPLRDPQPIDAEEAREEAILLGLRTCEGVPLSLLPPREVLDRYRDFSYIKDGRFILNERGFYLSNSIIRGVLE